MIISMLQSNPKNRPKVKDLINDPFITEGYTPSHLPASCLSMAPRFDQLEKHSKPMPLGQINGLFFYVYIYSLFSFTAWCRVHACINFSNLCDLGLFYCFFLCLLIFSFGFPFCYRSYVFLLFFKKYTQNLQCVYPIGTLNYI